MRIAYGVRTLAARALLVAAAWTACSIDRSTAAEYYNIGVGHTVFSLSGDGSVAAGDRVDGFFHWTAAGGVNFIGGNSASAGLGHGGDAGLSEDGAWLSGNFDNPQTQLSEMSRYNIASGVWTPLGSLGSSSGVEASSSWGISGDGQSLVGLGWVNAGSAHAIQWKQGGMVEDLGSTVVGSSSRANATDFDGDVVVGWQDSDVGARQAAIWQNGVQSLLTYNGEPVAEAQDVTPDGNWVVGVGGYGTLDQPWRYNIGTGELDLLGVINPDIFFGSRSATGVSDDGKTIVGFERDFFGFPAPTQGTIWREGIGLQDLTSFAINNGVPVPDGVQLTLPLAISGDGRVIAGINNQFEGFVVVLPEPATWISGVLATLALAGWAARKR